MKVKKYDELIVLANRAKNVRLYDMANIIFAILLSAAFRQSQHETELWLEWETQDEEGCGPEEVYYDLLDVCCWDIHQARRSLCIPVPLLRNFSALAALKRATIVPREEHGRVTSEASEEQIAELWVELGQLVTANQARFCIEYHLFGTDGEDQPFAERLIALAEEKLVNAQPDAAETE